MRKNTYIGIAFVVLIFGIIFIPKIFRRISNQDITRGGRMHAVGGVADTQGDDELIYITINGKDRKVPPFSFLNQDKDTISNADYRGKVYLVEFFFTRCTDICIPMSHNLQEIWNFMTGDRETIYRLSNEGFYLNVSYEAGLENGFYHSGLFALVDQNGFIRSRLDPNGNPKPYYRGSVPMGAEVLEGGEQPEIDILVEDINKLLDK